MTAVLRLSLYAAHLETQAMQDALYIGIAVLFFVLTWGLVRFCDHLERGAK